MGVFTDLSGKKREKKILGVFEIRWIPGWIEKNFD